MKGIIIGDLEQIKNSGEIYNSEVKKDIMNIKKSFSILKTSLGGGDLDGLVYKLNQEISQLDNVLLRINSYQTVLSNVLKSYKTRDEEVANALDRLAP